MRSWAYSLALRSLRSAALRRRAYPAAEVPWWAAVAISLILAAFGAMRRWQSLRSVALELDVRAKTKDRFLTALSLPANETRALLGAARRETSTFASTLSPREHLALRIPAKKALWLLLPVIALGLWEGFRVWKAMDLAPELAAAQKLVEQARRAAELEADKDETLQRIAEATATVRASAERFNRAIAGSASDSFGSRTKALVAVHFGCSRGRRARRGSVPQSRRTGVEPPGWKKRRSCKKPGQVGSGGTCHRIGTGRAPPGGKTPARACHAVGGNCKNATWRYAWLFNRRRQRSRPPPVCGRASRH